MKRKILLAIAIMVVIWVGVRTEIDLGKCLDNDGNGVCYNYDAPYNYIGYPEPIKANDVVVTVLVLNPLNVEIDDFIYRKDFVIKKGDKANGM